jgi:class 3 adenylate cyclase/tetratricopeptide (TPR) repeat protein
MPNGDENVLCFDRYKLDLRRGCLLRADRKIELRPKSFALLRCLVENAGRLVSKDELIKALWGDVAVTDVSLARCASDVRLALQDQAQQIIKTVPRRGYLFAAAVSVSPEESASPDQTPGPAQPDQHRGESRLLTAMACELVGLGALAARSDLEDLRKVTTFCHRRCSEVIERHHGYVARYSGDGLLAFFGYPHAREQDSENAVRAALALQQAAKDLTAELNMELRACIGIATGIVATGDELAAGKVTERTTIGETPIVSERLQALAEPGQVMLAESTRRLVEGLFEYRELGCVALKGLATPVRVSQVIGEAEIESRFEASHPSRLSPLVGRDEEIDLLMRRWQQAKAGEGCIALLVGEPGIGKSRVAQTVLGLVDREPHAHLRFFCSPHRQNSALSPFIDQLSRAAGLRRTDADGQRLNKLEATLARTAAVDTDAVPVLADLLSIPTGDRFPQPSMTPERRKAKTLAALLAHVEGMAASAPLLLVIEDVHWADPTSLELIDLIVERAPRLRALVVVTFRPEFVSPWASRAQTNLVSLGRLPPRPCAAIIASIIGDDSLATAIVDKIVARADGIPLFVEELTKAVVERGAPADTDNAFSASEARTTSDIPATLHASLLARLDHLGSARDVAQIGAALGRRFSYQLISAVATAPQKQVDCALTALVDAELIWRRGNPPNAEYTFKHALVQDAAYGTLLRDARRALHARIVDALEHKFPDTAEAQPEVLAHHCTEAGLTEKAAGLWSKAGQASLARSAIREAADQLGRAAVQLEALPTTPEHRQEQIKVQIALSNALMHTKGYAAPETRAALDQARRLVEHAEELSEPPEDPLLLFSVLHGFWVASHVAFDGDAVRDLSSEFMALAERQRSTFPLVLGHRVMGTSLLFLGDILGGRAHLDKAMSLYDPAEHRPLGTRFGQEGGVAILSNRPLALWLLGYPTAALEEADAALCYAQELGQTASFLYALARIAWFHLVVGTYDTAARQIDNLMSMAKEMEGSYWTAAGMILQGCMFALTGKSSTAIELINAGITVSRAKGSNLLRMPWYLSCTSRAHAALGQLDQAWRCLDDAVTAMDTTKEAWPRAELHCIAGDLALASSSPDTATAQLYFERAISVAREQKARSWELRAAIRLAALWRDLNERQRGMDLLGPIYATFTEGFETPDLKAAKTLLTEPTT